jgi:hypothetical protein
MNNNISFKKNIVTDRNMLDLELYAFYNSYLYATQLIPVKKA